MRGTESSYGYCSGLSEGQSEATVLGADRAHPRLPGAIGVGLGEAAGLALGRNPLPPDLIAAADTDFSQKEA